MSCKRDEFTRLRLCINTVLIYIVHCDNEASSSKVKILAFFIMGRL